MAALNLVEGVATGARKALPGRGNDVLRRRGLALLDKAEGINVLQPRPHLGPVRHRVLGQAVRVRQDDVPALPPHRVGPHAVGPIAEVFDVVQAVDALQRGDDMIGVEHRTKPHKTRISIAEQLVGQTAVLDLELRLVRVLRPHVGMPQPGRNCGKITWRHDLLLVVAAIE